MCLHAHVMQRGTYYTVKTLRGDVHILERSNLLLVMQPAQVRACLSVRQHVEV
jgi:hypothetical protein